MKQRGVNLSSGVTEQTSVASQGRAELMALTSNIREISPTAILVRHNRNIYKNTLHFEDLCPLTGQDAVRFYTSVYTASTPLSRMPELLPKGPAKVKTMPFFSHINKIHRGNKIPYRREDQSWTSKCCQILPLDWKRQRSMQEELP